MLASHSSASPCSPLGVRQGAHVLPVAAGFRGRVRTTRLLFSRSAFESYVPSMRSYVLRSWQGTHSALTSSCRKQKWERSPAAGRAHHARENGGVGHRRGTPSHDREVITSVGEAARMSLRACRVMSTLRRCRAGSPARDLSKTTAQILRSRVLGEPHARASLDAVHAGP